MKTQTQTETETEAETKTGVHQQPQHALVAGARTFIWPWPMAQCLIRLRVQLRVRVGQAGAPRTHRCTSTSTSTSMAIVLEASLARINFRPTLFTVCSALLSSLSALLGSALCLSCLHVDSLRRFSDPEVAEFAQAGPRSRSIFMASSGNWRWILVPHSLSTPSPTPQTCPAPFLASPLPLLYPFLWHLARFLFKIHNCRRQRRVIVGEFATPCCLAASRLPPPAASAPFPCYSFGAAKKSITFLHMFQLRVTLRCAYVICCCRGCCRKKTTSHPWCSN